MGTGGAEYRARDPAPLPFTLLFWNVHLSVDSRVGDGSDLPTADVYALVETNFNDLSAASYVFPLPGFLHFWQCRPSGTSGGGVSVFVREGLSPTLHSRTASPEALLISLGDRTLLLGVVYHPPIGSHSTSDPSLPDLKDHLIACPPHSHTLLIGDFNARIGMWQGSTDLDLEGPLPPRVTQDLNLNPYGPHLTAFAESLGLLPLNGRVPGDLEGVFTYVPKRTRPPSPTRDHRVRLAPALRRVPALDTFSSDSEGSDPGECSAPPSPSTPVPGGRSVVDLALCTPSLLPHVQSLEVKSTHFSDHSLLCLSLTLPSLSQTHPTPSQSVPQRKPPFDWDSAMVQFYQAEVRIVLPKLSRAASAVSSAPTLVAAARATKVYMAILRGCRSRAAAKRHTLRAARRGPRDPRPLGVKEWWSQDLRVLRQTILQTRHSTFPSRAQLADLHKLRSDYRRLLRKRRQEYEDLRDSLLRKQLRGNPRGFWRWWNGPSPTATITPDAFLAYLAAQAPPPLRDTHLASPDPSPSAAPLPLPPPSTPPSLGDPALDAPFSVREVVDAVYHLHNGRASADGISAELLRWARDPEVVKKKDANYLQGDLSSIINRVFLDPSGVVPPSWLNAFVVPVYKGKGDATAPASHRPITVSGVLYKLYAQLLLTRFTAFLETRGARAPTQLGFRAHKGTDLAVWLLHHCISTACAPVRHGGDGGYLHACFVDMKQAFDSVDRPTLWARVQELGVGGGPMFQALQALYASTQFGVRVGSAKSTSTYATHRGVKQGCPLSPLLFGLIMDRLYHRLLAECPALGVCLKGSSQWVNHIMYADDVVLFARSPSELQCLVDSLQRFCVEVGLQVNCAKSVCLTFKPGPRSPDLPPLVVTVGGVTLPVVDTFTYLGVVFHPVHWASGAGAVRAQAATRSLWALWGQAASQRLSCRDSLLRIFRTKVLPSATYGGGIWGAKHLTASTALAVLASPPQQVQDQFLRLLSGAHPHAARWVLMRNAGLDPLHLYLLQAACRIWTCCSRDPSSLLGQALLSDLHLFKKGWTRAWSGFVLEAHVVIGVFPRTIIHTGRDPLDLFRLSFSPITATIHARTLYQKFWDVEAAAPLRAPHLPSSASIARFCSYIYTPGSSSHMTLFASSHLVTTLFRFRVGCAGLRCSRHAQDRQRDRMRSCLLCEAIGTPGLVEDEKHVLMDCPAYRGVREDTRFVSLFTLAASSGLPALFAVPNQTLLATCIVRILHVRSVCYDALDSQD